jgi:hypothetical protein
MKYFHLWWVEHVLTSYQKGKRVAMIKWMVQQLAIKANVGFSHQPTCDESWMAYDDTPSRMWTRARSDVDPIARPTCHYQKTMMTILLGVKNIILVHILTGKSKLSSRYFRESMFKELDLIVYPTRRKPHATPMRLHFDIVWSESTCPSLTRWDLECAFHGSISPQCAAFGKLTRSNWIWLCRFLKNDLSILDITIREWSVYDGIWSESNHSISLQRGNRR